MTLIVEIDASTGIETSREMTAAEQKTYDAYIKKEIESETKRQAEAEAKAIAKAAILDRIGLTADEAKLFLG
jgi:hypothetical protein